MASKTLADVVKAFLLSLLDTGHKPAEIRGAMKDCGFISDPARSVTPEQIRDAGAKALQRDREQHPPCPSCGMRTGHLAACAHGVMEAPAPTDDAALLDYIQRTGSTVELLPDDRFRIGGLHAAVSTDLRAAIRIAAGACGVGAVEGRQG